MKVIYGLRQIKRFRKPVVALGVFDGVHRGHTRILRSAVKIAHRIKGTSIALTFKPHPQREDSLCSLEHRLRLIGELGIDICIVINFNRVFSRILAEDFIKGILVKKINAHYICVGKNFRFGRGAKGNFKLLERYACIYNFKLKAHDVIKINHLPISSTHIRKLIAKGDLKAAARLLSRPLSILGTVIKGVSLAKRLGFPTANINPHHEVLPPSGVWAVKVIFGNKKLYGLCYIGTKPTFKNLKSLTRLRRQEKYIEVYIFNFNRNIYGKYLEIRFIKKLRGERKFRSCTALVEQIQKDIVAAKKLFSRHRLTPQYMPIKIGHIH